MSDMLKEETTKKSYSRKASLQDFLDDIPVVSPRYNQSQNDVIIAKNQQEFGNKKRIKP